MKIWLALLIIGTSGILLELKRNQIIQTTNIEMDSYMGLSDFYMKELETSLLETEHENADFVNESNLPGNEKAIENYDYTDSCYECRNNNDTFDYYGHSDHSENELNELISYSYEAVEWTLRGSIPKQIEA